MPNEQETVIVPDKLSSTPLSANGDSSGITKCIKCGSVFLKSKVGSAENRGTCYACFLKMKKRSSPFISSVFKNYLVTDENKQSYFICDLCNFSCDALPDIFAHHYKNEHPGVSLDKFLGKKKNDPLSRFACEKNEIRWYRCDLCELSCISRNLFVKHYTEHGDGTFQMILADSSMIQFKDDKFCCVSCPKTFVQLGAARRHFNTIHVEKKFQCSVCQKAFTHAHKVKKHEKRHLKIKFFMCDICGKRFVHKANMEKHMKNNLCAKYTCSSCNQTFSDKVSLTKHILYWENCKKSLFVNGQPAQQIQQNADPKKEALLKYECAKCKKKFKSKIALRIHIVEEFNLKPYKCFICDQQFTTTVLLRSHLISCNKSILDTNQCDDISITKGDNSFGCKLCGRTFRKIGYLRQHFRLHSTSSTKPYVCQFCGKSYTMKSSFQSHLSTEMNLRKFACSVCGKRYNSGSHLTAHIKKHHRLREFKCNKCDKEFAYERDLKEHEKTHSEIKEFFCDKCGGFFKTERYLKVHWERCNITKE